MRSFSSGVFLAAALLGSASAATAGETLDRVLKNKVLVEVTDQAYPPFSYVNETGDVIGLDVDISKEIAKRLGVGYKVETPSWEIIASGHWNGRWDICVCSMTPTQERAQVLDFVNEYYAAPAVIIVHVDNTGISGAADLTDKKVGVQAGTTYEKYLMKELSIEKAEPIEFPFEQATVVPFNSEDTAFQDLALGSGKRLDAVISNYLVAKERVEKNPDKFKIVGDPVFAEPVWVAIDKGDPEWAAKIKEVFKEMKADGTLKAIFEKWIGTDISSKQM